jgi:hypothetical protein
VADAGCVAPQLGAVQQWEAVEHCMAGILTAGVPLVQDLQHHPHPEQPNQVEASPHSHPEQRTQAAAVAMGQMLLHSERREDFEALALSQQEQAARGA